MGRVLSGVNSSQLGGNVGAGFKPALTKAGFSRGGGKAKA